MTNIMKFLLIFKVEKTKQFQKSLKTVKPKLNGDLGLKTNLNMIKLEIEFWK